jgi:DNA-directed RNA polymerase I, II, and III subunit RPABC2
MHSSYFDGEPDDNDNYKGESDNNDDDDDDESSLSSQEPENNENDDNNELDGLDGLDGGGAEEGIDLEEIDDDDDNDDEFSKENEDENLEEEEENYEETETKVKKVKTIPTKNIYKKPLDLIDDDDDDDDDDDGEQYLQKFEQSVNDNYILNFHPESVLQNYNEILTMTNVIRNDNGIIIDKLHRTIPYLTKYEKARILGQRAKQINSGAYPFVKVPENVIDGYIIAEMELKQKRIPFIIRRPLPNGGSEYWKVKDLEDISF